MRILILPPLPTALQHASSFASPPSFSLSDFLVTSSSFCYCVLHTSQWMFMPTAAALLWCAPSAPSRRWLHHPIVSHSYSATPPEAVTNTDTNADADGGGQEDFFALPAECAMLGTRDYSSMLVVPAALGFAEVRRAHPQPYSAAPLLCSAPLLHRTCFMQLADL